MEFQPHHGVARMLGLVLLFAAGASAKDVPADAVSQPPLTPRTLESGGVMPAEQRALHFDHAELHFGIDPAHHHLDGRARLTFTALATTPVVLLDLDPHLPISRLSVDGRALNAAQWSNPDGRLRISLAQPLNKGDRTTVEIDYAGQPHVAKKAPWDGGFVWAHTADGQPWVASAVEGEGCDLFWPCIDQTEGEPDLVDTYISVPKPLAAPGNGVLVDVSEHGGQRIYHWRAKHPNTYAIAIDVGPFERLQAKYVSRYGNTVALEFWYLHGHEAQARELFSEFPHMLDFFEQEIGPYPFADEKMGVVETPHMGMEHQTINAYGNGYAKGPYGFDWLLQHEFSHEWFGNQLTNADWDDMWLHEGFGSYMQPLYGQYLYGDMPYYSMLHEQRVLLKNQHPIVAGHSQTESAVYDEDHGPGNDIYAKGSLMLHSLRQLIGDQAFFESIRRLVYGRADPRPGNFKPRYASTRDYIDIVDQVTGQDLHWFFDVYLYEAALPVLEQRHDGDSLTLHWKVPHDKPFPMPVEVQVADHVVVVPMRDGHGEITAPAGVLLIVDPHSKLLREMPHIGVYQQWRKQQAAAKKTS